MSSASFSAVITKENLKGGWTYVVWTESAGFLGTRRATKVQAKIGDHEFGVTCMPRGDGTHMLPLSRSVMSKISKTVGDKVVVEVRKTR